MWQGHQVLYVGGEQLVPAVLIVLFVHQAGHSPHYLRDRFKRRLSNVYCKRETKQV